MGARLFQRGFHPLGGQVSLRVDVNVAAGGARGVRSYERALQQSVGRPLHEVPVLEESGFAFFRVDHQEAGFGKGPGPLPLTGRREIRAAPALKARFQYLGNYLFRGAGESVGQAAKTADANVVINICGVQ